MLQDIKDEILSGDPRYTIRDSSGNVLNDNVDISLKTPIIQEGAPINRALFRNLQGDLYTQDRYNVPTLGETDEYSGSGDYWYSNRYYSATFTHKDSNVNYDITNLLKNNSDIVTRFSGSSGDTATLIVKNNCKLKINQMGIKGYLTPPNTSNPKVFRVYGSNDSSTWTLLYTNSTEISNTLVTIDINSEEYYQYIKFEFDMEETVLYLTRLYISSWSVKYFMLNIDIPLTSYEKNKIVNIVSLADSNGKCYLNINNLGAKLINDTIDYGKKYSLVYNGESWDSGTAFITGTFTSAETIKTIEVGFTPDLVICYSIGNNSPKITNGNSISANTSDVPRILTKAYYSEYGKIVSGGFTYIISNDTQTTAVYYIAIRL